MHISTERFITTLQYPLAPPLPLLTDGFYPSHVDAAACATFLGRTVDQSATAVSRLVLTPLLVTTGAMGFGYAGLSPASLRMLPLACAGVVVGVGLGVFGASISCADVAISSVGAVLMLVWLAGRFVGQGVYALLGTFGRRIA